MSLLPPDATLAEMLEECVAAFRGRGVGLSPRDLQTLSGWLGEGMPPTVVARGVAAFARTARWDRAEGEATFFSLAACRFHVKQAWEWHRQRHPGQYGPLPQASRMTEARWAGDLRAAQAQARFREPATRLLTLWQQGHAQDLHTHRRRSRALPFLLARSLPYAARRVLLVQARMSAPHVLTSGPWSAKSSPAFLRSVRMRQALGLATL